VEGEDLYESGVAERVEIVAVAHRIQRASGPAVAELLAAGVPDRRGAAMGRWIRAELCEHTDHVGAHPATARLVELLAGLDEKLVQASDCGLPDALVHGDEHPGNAIAREGGASADQAGIVLLDWGDSYVGHPAFDALRLGVGLPPEEKEQVVAAWVEAWLHGFPGSDPKRAVDQLRAVEPLRLAAVYASFLRQIEPTERRYHAGDVRDCLDRALETTVS
jgi:aminoglycoside phosphotransferase (APT) family kinase protein